MFESMKAGMARTRQRFAERMNELLDRGPDVDEDFWDGLEEALILSDVGAALAAEIVEDARRDATRRALPDAYAVLDGLTDRIAAKFAPALDLYADERSVLVFVGVNGAGKTTTTGKLAAEATARGRRVLLGSADTFRAAAIEQLEVWATRAGVQIVERERGSDPASVCYETLERAEAEGSDFVLIDTAGRLHTSDDLMRELAKVVSVVRRRASAPVRVVLVIDATTGQNGLAQARQFHAALDLDALVLTKLDGTAKGGIALAISNELGLPIAKAGVGERLEDLQDFDPREFAAALIGAEEQLVEDGSDEPATTAPAEDAGHGPEAKPAPGDAGEGDAAAAAASEEPPAQEEAPRPEPASASPAEPEPEPAAAPLTEPATEAGPEAAEAPEAGEAADQDDEPREQSVLKRIFSWARR